jgi:hypothetical protein
MDRSEELKKRYKRITNEIRNVLINNWDPVNIKEDGNRGNEYDSYIGGIYDLLMEHAPAKKISTHLSSVEKIYLGFEASPKSLLDVAEELMKIDVT